jgi:hypothetical protein
LDIKCDIQLDILVGFLKFQNIHSTLVHTWANNVGRIGHDEGKEDICLPKQRKLMTKYAS